MMPVLQQNERKQKIMKQVIIDLGGANTPTRAGTVDAVLSFRPFFDYVKKKITTGQTDKLSFYQFVFEKLKQFELMDDPVNIEDSSRYAELFQLIHASITGITTEDDETLWGLASPITSTIFYGTDALINLLVDKKNHSLNKRVWDADEIEKRKLTFIYSGLLEKFYDYALQSKNGMAISFTDPATGLLRFFQINKDSRFINVTAKEKLPALNFRKLEKHIHEGSFNDYMQKKLPLSLFSFRGFNIIFLTDITVQHVIENIKNSIIQSATRPKEACVGDAIHSLKTLIGSKDIDFGFIPLVRLNNRPLLEFGSLSNSILLHNSLAAGISEQNFMSLINAYLKQPVPVFLKGVDKYKKSSHPLLAILKQSRVTSFALIPLFHNSQLAGVMEVYSKKDDILDERKLLRLDAVLPYLAQLIKTSVDDFYQKLSNIVNEKFTSIQTSVQWRFYESAWHYMQKKFLQKKDADIETIIFEKMYPLYGAIDIRNSSIERNNATREDLSCQLELLINAFNKISKDYHLALIDEIIFKARKWLTVLQEGLSPSEEYKLNSFLGDEVMSILQHLKKIQPASKAIIDDYIEALDEKKGKAHENRRNLELSMQLINSGISNYLDLMKIELQQSYPCYFEKIRTDGVEYDIYIGQAIAPEKPFDLIYLKNLRLWQLQSMAAIYKLVQGLQSQMPKLLHITQLIFINGDTIDISFRNDEKRFDVEGAYNIRYQVIKKRIDKVHIKDTDERLTQPGKIALVYFNNKEAEEYVSYINYLQEQNILENNLEFLDLEELQGVAGLRALRVGIVAEP